MSVPDDATSSGGIVLLYHRIARLDSDPQLLAVTPEHFDDHLRVLSRVATSISLSGMVAAAREGRLRANAVAITFDDGYADNFHFAAPLLIRHECPGTIFATTAHTDTLYEFFWDELDRLILQPHPLPTELVLECDETVRRFNAGLPWKQARGWNVLQPADAGSRQQLYLELCSVLHRMNSSQRSSCLRQLRAQVGIGSTGREVNRMMTSRELREIGSGGLIDIGAHTVTHPLLINESDEQQSVEIRQSRQTLERIIGKPVTCFSYPFGTRRDYAPSTPAAVEAAGFELACSNFTGKVQADTDRFQLPRMIVRDWTGEEFEQRLTGWLDG